MTQYILPSLCMFIAGIADGLNQVLQFRYDALKQRFPKINDWYWEPNKSWVNKYKANNPGFGPKFFGSTTVFVWISDGYHLTRFIQNLFIATSLTLATRITIPDKWYYYAISGIWFWGIFRVGFNIIFRSFK